MRSTTSSERVKHGGGVSEVCLLCLLVTSEIRLLLGCSPGKHREKEQIREQERCMENIYKTYKKKKKNWVLFASSCFSPEDKT